MNKINVKKCKYWIDCIFLVQSRFIACKNKILPENFENFGLYWHQDWHFLSIFYCGNPGNELKSKFCKKIKEILGNNLENNEYNRKFRKNFGEWSISWKKLKLDRMCAESDWQICRSFELLDPQKTQKNVNFF